MPRTSLPKGNALIRKISRKNDTSSHPKGNALIRQISRGNRMKNRLSPQPAGPGRTVQDAIVLDDDDDDQGNDLANVAKPEEMEADLEITGMNVDIILVRAPPNPEPFDANAMPPPPMVRQGFRHNPLHQNAGTAADQPISLLDSDSDDTAATAVPRPTQSRPVAAGKAKVIQETLLRTADKAISASGRKRKAKDRERHSRTPSDRKPSIREARDSSESEDDPDGYGRRPSDAESSRPRKHRRQQPPSMPTSPVATPRSSSPMDPSFYCASVVSEPSDASSESEYDEYWESFLAGFPSMFSDVIHAVKQDPVALENARSREAEVDASSADKKAVLGQCFRRKALGVIMESIKPERPVQAVFMDRRGQEISAPEFPWDFNDVGPVLSVRRISNVIMDQTHGHGSYTRELRSHGARRSLQVVKQLVGTSGGIWATEQSRNGTIAIAASVVDGEERWRFNHERYTLNAYNKAGNLSTWRKKDEDDEAAAGVADGDNLAEVELLHGHSFREVYDRDLSANRTHYSIVYNVTFDPFTDDTFISCSSDGTVRKWDRLDDQSKHVNTRTWTYAKHPDHLMYHAKERMFAVGSSDGLIHIHRDADSTTQRSFKGNERNRQISSMKWGTGRTDRMLFFATEHPDSERNDGEAYAANYSDESSTEALYPFPGVPGGGAVMALDGTGSRLAIVAGRSDNRARQSLMIYEPQLLDADTVLECRLPEFGYIAHPASLSGECHIMDVQFSPCGSYIAVARDNNCALIYDIRNAAKPLHVFGHVTYSRDDMESRFGERWGSKAAYGISNLGWIGHNTIITGGADGCVRRWNTNVATRNMGGKVIARLDQPVAHLSFADDTLEHRYPLIAGDMEGKVYVFDYEVGQNGGCSA